MTLLAHHQHATATAAAAPPRPAAWYRKAHPTRSEALASVRREVWQHQTFHTSSCRQEVINVPRVVVERLTETLCDAA